MKDIIAYIAVKKEETSDVSIMKGWGDELRAKEISLTDCIIGFEQFKEGYIKKGVIFIEYSEYYGKSPKEWTIYTIESLLDIYLEEKGIITEH